MPEEEMVQEKISLVFHEAPRPGMMIMGEKSCIDDVGVGVTVEVGVIVDVGVGEGVEVTVGVAVTVGVIVRVGVMVTVGVTAGVMVGSGIGKSGNVSLMARPICILDGLVIPE